MKKIFRYPLLLIFCVFILSLSLANLLKPARSFSDLENRYLAKRPNFSLKSFLNSTFSSKYETYLNDQFVFRDGWITIKSVSESALGKTENNGIVYGKDGYLFEKLLASDGTQLEKNLNALKTFLQTYQGSTTVGIIPSSYEVLRSKLPVGLENINQAEAIRRIYQEIHEDSVSTLPLLDTLEKHSGEYIYYRTDHHWTTLGAYYGYETYCTEKGLEPAAPDFPSEEVGGFYGTYFSKAKLHSAQSDTITYYDIPVAEMTADLEKKDGLYQVEQFSKRDKYAAFLYGNHGLTVIKSEHFNNTETPKRLLVIKDSFANCLIPYLVQNYDEITVIDLRHFSIKMSYYLDGQNFDDTLILYNYLNFSNDVNLYKLNT